MKLGITGSRTVEDFDFSSFFRGGHEMFNTFLGHEKISRILVGGAKGIDALAEKCAMEHNIEVGHFLPDYRKYHRGAPLKRNELIVAESDAILAVWNGDPASRGTLFTIKYALSHGKRVFLIRIDNDIPRLIGEICKGWDSAL